MFEIVLAILGTLLSRFLYWRRFSEFHFAGDANSHLLMVKMIRENNLKIPLKIERFILNHNDYPQGFHKLMAYLPLSLEKLEFYGGLVSALFDVLLLVFISTLVLFYGGKETAWLLLFPFIRLLWGRDARGIHFGERSYGLFFGIIYLTSAFLFVETGEWYWLAGSLISFTGFSTSSKFAWQAVTFFSVLLSLFLWEGMFLVIFGACLLVSALVTRGYNLRVLRGALLYSNHYRKHRQARSIFRKYYLELLRVFYRFKQSRFIYYFFENPIAMIISNCPISIVFMVTWWESGWIWTSWHAYALCGVILVLIVSTEPLKFLGKPERYLEYSILPIFIVLSHYPLETHTSLFVIALALGVAAVMFHHGQKKEKVREDEPIQKAYQELESYLQKCPGSIILTFPLKVAFELGYRLEHHRYVCNFTHCSDIAQYQEYENLTSDLYPFPGNNLEKYIARYNIDYLVVYKSSIEYINTRLSQNYYDFSKYKKIFKNHHFDIYETRSKLVAQSAEG